MAGAPAAGGGSRSGRLASARALAAGAIPVGRIHPQLPPGGLEVDPGGLGCGYPHLLRAGAPLGGDDQALAASPEYMAPVQSHNDRLHGRRTPRPAGGVRQALPDLAPGAGTVLFATGGVVPGADLRSAGGAAHLRVHPFTSGRCPRPGGAEPPVGARGGRLHPRHHGRGLPGRPGAAGQILRNYAAPAERRPGVFCRTAITRK